MSELLKPPAVTSAILSFFSGQPDFAAVIGDMSEEFHQRVQSSGAQSAKLWYWREAFRNAGALTAREVLWRPGRTIIVALGCFLAVNLVTGLYVLYALRFGIDPSLWWVLLLLQLVTPLLLGWTGGRLLPGREWALALTYTLVSACWFGAGVVVIWHISGSFVPFPHLPVPLRVLALFGNAFRQGAFWLPCLLVRRSKNIKTRSLTHA